jgi:hypothetical protein
VNVVDAASLAASENATKFLVELGGPLQPASSSVSSSSSGTISVTSDMATGTTTATDTTDQNGEHQGHVHDLVTTVGMPHLYPHLDFHV